MSDPQWTALGDQQEVTGHRQIIAEDRFEQDYAYALKSGTHLWIVTLMHRALDSTLDAFDGETTTPILDADTIMQRPMVGCYVCEQSYEPRLRKRRCPGEPRGAR